MPAFVVHNKKTGAVAGDSHLNPFTWNSQSEAQVVCDHVNETSPGTYEVCEWADSGAQRVKVD